MLENDENVGYSMPRQNGLYPPPPIIYKGARALALMFQCIPNLKKDYLPPELVSIEVVPIKINLECMFLVFMLMMM